MRTPHWLGWPGQSSSTGPGGKVLPGAPTPHGQLDLVTRQGQGGCGVVCFSATMKPLPSTKDHPALWREQRYLCPIATGRSSFDVGVLRSLGLPTIRALIESTRNK